MIEYQIVNKDEKESDNENEGSESNKELMIDEGEGYENESSRNSNLGSVRISPVNIHAVAKQSARNAKAKLRKVLDVYKDSTTTAYNVQDPHCGVVVITTAQFPSAKSEFRFCTGSNPARDVSEICDGGNLWQWSRLEIKHKRLLLVRHSTKRIHLHHHHHHLKRSKMFLMQKKQKPTELGRLHELLKEKLKDATNSKKKIFTFVLNSRSQKYCSEYFGVSKYLI